MSDAGNNAIGPQGIEDPNDLFSSPEVLRTLVSHIPDWKTAKSQKHGRRRFYKAIAAEINVVHKLNRIDRKSMNELAMKLKHWYPNHVRGLREEKVKHGVVSTKVWNARMVIGEQYREEIEAEIKRLTAGEEKGGLLWIKNYQRCVSKVIDGLTKQEYAEYEIKAREYNLKGPDNNIRQRLAVQKANEYFLEFQRQMDRQLGVKVFGFGAYKEPGGQVVVLKTTSYSGVKFTTDVPAWSKNAWTAWREWADNAFDENQIDDDSNIPPLTNDKSVPREIQRSENGQPILPPFDPAWGLAIHKDIIRGYVSILYRCACNNPRAVVPWASLVEDQDIYINGDYLPEADYNSTGQNQANPSLAKVVLREPSKLRKLEVRALWKLWYTMQTENKMVKLFKVGNDKDFFELGAPVIKKRKRRPANYLEEDDEEENSTDSEARESRPKDPKGKVGVQRKRRKGPMDNKAQPKATHGSLHSVNAGDELSGSENAGHDLSGPGNQENIPTGSGIPPRNDDDLEEEDLDQPRRPKPRPAYGPHRNATKGPGLAGHNADTDMNGSDKDAPDSVSQSPTSFEDNSPASVETNLRAKCKFMVKCWPMSKSFAGVIKVLQKLPIIIPDIESMPIFPWASWTYNSSYLPAGFHSIEGFTAFVNWLDSKPYLCEDGSLRHRFNLVTICLALSMARRDIGAATAIEDDAPDESIPLHVQSSEVSLVAVHDKMENFCIALKAAIDEKMSSIEEETRAQRRTRHGTNSQPTAQVQDIPAKAPLARSNARTRGQTKETDGKRSSRRTQATRKQ